MLEKKSVQIFSDVRQAVSEMTFQKMEKGSIFVTRPVSQMSKTFFLLGVGSSMIALFKALIWLYNSYLTIIELAMYVCITCVR